MGGAHHTRFSFDVTPNQRIDFAEMQGVEVWLINDRTDIEDFEKELRWNAAYDALQRGG